MKTTKFKKSQTAWFRKAIILILIFLSISNTIIAQVQNSNLVRNNSLSIKGIVYDENKQTLIGVTVLVVGEKTGTVTNIDGEYQLNNVKSGSIIRFSYIGYKTEEIVVNDNSNLDVTLNSDSKDLKEVIVTAQAIGQKNAINQQINSNTLKNVVSSERLRGNPDANATEAIGRLPGISVQRSGGEGVGLVIRGLAPKYTAITLNGVELPSTAGSDRSTNLNGVSQYALQGAEVFKSLTADMDANSVAGAVNLKLREAPKGFNSNIMVQTGYNQLNNYFGNYKLMAETSNRFFNNKLGIIFTGTAERVNRSVQTMNSGYSIDSSDPNGDILLNSTNLNINSSFIYRQSAMLAIDYHVSHNTLLKLYGLYNRSQNKKQSQSKSYGITGTGSVGYNFNDTPNSVTQILQTALSGESKFDFLNVKAEYGVSYSKGQNNNLGERSWSFTFDNSSTSAITDIEHRKLDPSEIIPLFTDKADRIMSCWLNNIGVKDSRIKDENFNSYINLTIPFTIGDFVTANIKLGGLVKSKTRFRDDMSGSQYFASSLNQFAGRLLLDSIDYLVKNPSGNISANGLVEGTLTDFLGGKYDFGNTFNFDRLNEIAETWNDISDYYYAKGPSVFLPMFGEIGKIGYRQNVSASMLNDQDIVQKYAAGYIMSEVNFGKYVMLLPGVRLEHTSTTMNGTYAMPPQQSPPISAAVPGYDTSAVHSDRYILPMVHMRIKPTKFSYIHFAYTQTLSRPDFNAISSNYFVNTGVPPFSYTSTNPHLKSELWTSYDAQFVLHANKIGLLAINGFYKTVKDKIWNRSYTRLKDDPIIDPFPNNAVVNVSTWENHSYIGFVKGLELEWQTAFSYLPKPFCYLTFSANYTYTNSKTSYPYTRLENKVPTGGGRPVVVRVDSVIEGSMLNQPKHIVNSSLGFNKNGFNAWLSFQYNGQIYTGINFKGVPRLNSEKAYFYRWDLQITQKFNIKNINGFEVLLNIANISNYMESQKLSGDIRNTYIEQYGATADIGIRYRF